MPGKHYNALEIQVLSQEIHFYSKGVKYGKEYN
jgi:hypothetical protein